MERPSKTFLFACCRDCRNSSPSPAVGQHVRMEPSLSPCCSRECITLPERFGGTEGGGGGEGRGREMGREGKREKA